MADPIVSDSVVEGGKIVGSGGAGMIVLGLIQRWFKKEDDGEKLMMALLNEIKAGQAVTQVSVNTLSSDVRLLTDRGVRSDAEQAQMRAELSELRLKVAGLEGRLQQISEGLIP